MAVMSSLDFWLPLLVAVALVAAIWGGFRMRMMLVTAGLAIAVTDALVVRTLKDFVGRPRPHEMLAGVRTLDLAAATPRFLALTKSVEGGILRLAHSPLAREFVSVGACRQQLCGGHGLRSIFSTMGMAPFSPRNSSRYSRVYVGSHWPLDVLVSCLLGLGIGLLVVVGVEAVWRRWGGLWLPRLHTATQVSLLCERANAPALCVGSHHRALSFVWLRNRRQRRPTTISARSALPRRILTGRLGQRC